MSFGCRTRKKASNSSCSHGPSSRGYILALALAPQDPNVRGPGESGTRDALLEAARRMFAERGYEGASLRAIAAAVGVEAALVAQTS